VGAISNKTPIEPRRHCERLEVASRNPLSIKAWCKTLYLRIRPAVERLSSRLRKHQGSQYSRNGGSNRQFTHDDQDSESRN
jgi:ribosome-associated translation inhibitor RaiA